MYLGWPEQEGMVKHLGIAQPVLDELCAARLPPAVGQCNQYRGSGEGRGRPVLSDSSPARCCQRELLSQDVS